MGVMARALGARSGSARKRCASPQHTTCLTALLPTAACLWRRPVRCRVDRAEKRDATRQGRSSRDTRLTTSSRYFRFSHHAQRCTSPAIRGRKVALPHRKSLSHQRRCLHFHSRIGPKCHVGSSETDAISHRRQERSDMSRTVDSQLSSAKMDHVAQVVFPRSVETTETTRRPSQDSCAIVHASCGRIESNCTATPRLRRAARSKLSPPPARRPSQDSCVILYWMPPADGCIQSSCTRRRGFKRQRATQSDLPPLPNSYQEILRGAVPNIFLRFR